MPKGPKGEKRPADVVANAVHIMRVATKQVSDTKRDVSTEANRKGGLSGNTTSKRNLIQGIFGGDLVPRPKGELRHEKPFENNRLACAQPEFHQKFRIGKGAHEGPRQSQFYFGGPVGRYSAAP